MNATPAGGRWARPLYCPSRSDCGLYFEFRLILQGAISPAATLVEFAAILSWDRRAARYPATTGRHFERSEESWGFETRDFIGIPRCAQNEKNQVIDRCARVSAIEGASAAIRRVGGLVWTAGAGRCLHFRGGNAGPCGRGWRGGCRGPARP